VAPRNEVKLGPVLFGIAIGYWLEDRGLEVRFSAGTGNFSLHPRVQTRFGAHPASYTMGKGGSFPGVKWPGCESDQSPCNAEVKNAWRYNSTPPHTYL